MAVVRNVLDVVGQVVLLGRIVDNVVQAPVSTTVGEEAARAEAPRALLAPHQLVPPLDDRLPRGPPTSIFQAVGEAVSARIPWQTSKVAAAFVVRVPSLPLARLPQLLNAPL